MSSASASAAGSSLAKRRNRVVGRIEAVGIDPGEIGRRGLGALAFDAVLDPQRRIGAGRIERLDRRLVLAVQNAVGLGAEQFVDLLGDLLVAGCRGGASATGAERVSGGGRRGRGGNDRRSGRHTDGRPARSPTLRRRRNDRSDRFRRPRGRRLGGQGRDGRHRPGGRTRSYRRKIVDRWRRQIGRFGHRHGGGDIDVGRGARERVMARAGQNDHDRGGGEQEMKRDPLMS